MRDLLTDALERATRYLAGLDARGVAPTPEALANLVALDVPLPDTPGDPAATLAVLDESASPATMANAGGRFFGFVTGGVLPATLAANWLAGAWDQNSFSAVSSPATVAIEAVALRWLVDVLGLPSGTGGAFVTGATMANFTALAAARHAVLDRAGWNVEDDGLFGAPAITVYVGAEAHPSLLKALSMLGLGRKRVIILPVDAQGRIVAADLPEITGPAIVCLQAGNVNSGAFDPAPPLIAWAHAADAWVHVDGAFGLWAAVSPTHRHLLAGYDAADSWATDAHKWLNVPYDSGLAFVRDPAHLRSALALQRVAYLPDGAAREPQHYTPEASRRARGVEVWAALHSLGRTGLAELIERTCRHATRFAERLHASGYDILNDVVLNQVVVVFGTDEQTRQIVAGIQADGTCWCGITEWRGRAAMRISVSSWATTDADVERSLAAMLRVAHAVIATPRD
jgi:glutamate/tyrosine decarboxylase-like PLP-dependent enzyme